MTDIWQQNKVLKTKKKHCLDVDNHESYNLKAKLKTLFGPDGVSPCLADVGHDFAYHLVLFFLLRKNERKIVPLSKHWLI